MRSTKRPRIFDDDNVKRGSCLRIKTPSIYYCSSRFSTSTNVITVDQMQQISEFGTSSAPLSDSPLEEQLFVPPISKDGSFQSSDSLFRALMAKDSVSAKNFQVVASSVESQEFGIQNDFYRNSVENFEIIEQAYISKLIKKQNEVQSKTVVRFLSGTIDVRGFQKRIEDMNYSIKALEKENGCLRGKIVDLEMTNLRK